MEQSPFLNNDDDFFKSHDVDDNGKVFLKGKYVTYTNKQGKQIRRFDPRSKKNENAEKKPASGDGLGDGQRKLIDKVYGGYGKQALQDSIDYLKRSPAAKKENDPVITYLQKKWDDKYGKKEGSDSLAQAKEALTPKGHAAAAKNLQKLSGGSLKENKDMTKLYTESTSGEITVMETPRDKFGLKAMIWTKTEDGKTTYEVYGEGETSIAWDITDPKEAIKELNARPKMTDARAKQLAMAM